jgi:hypothetical protein
MPTKEQIEAIIKELQRIMRLQDWDLFYNHCTKAEMLLHTEASDNLGYYSVNIKRNCADIYLNIEAEDNQKEWYGSLVHELYHIVTISYRIRVLEMKPFLDEKYREEIKRDSTDYYEQMVDNLTRIFVKLHPVTNFKHILEA